MLEGGEVPSHSPSPSLEEEWETVKGRLRPQPGDKPRRPPAAGHGTAFYSTAKYGATLDSRKEFLVQPHQVGFVAADKERHVYLVQLPSRSAPHGRPCKLLNMLNMLFGWVWI